MQLSDLEIEFLIQKLQNNEVIPLDFKEKIFPTIQKEYELQYAGKMRKEDILADEDGVVAVPLQISNVYNNERKNIENDWKNMIVFGDNLQFLKTIYKNEDALIKDKVKGKVKLIYIDPPFGTGDEYDGNKGQKAYSAKVKGADFVEFIRKRLIIAKEILADDGSIFVRQDYHFGHYIKLVLDEVFGKDNFRNEFSVNRIKKNAVLSQKQKVFPTATDVVLFYAKTDTFYLEDISKKREKERKGFWRHMDDSAGQGGEKIFFGKSLSPPIGKHFKYSQDNIDKLTLLQKIRLVCKNCGYIHYKGDWGNSCQKCKANNNVKPEYWVEPTDFEVIDSNWTDIAGYSNSMGYPTENSEDLLERVIKSSTQEGDLVLDFFGGSGTTIAVAEKLGRKWITCDIGKLSFYTMQKRMLQIQNSKSLENTTKKYEKLANAFITVNTGLYDLPKLFQLSHEKYTKFVLDLFQATEKKHYINGLEIDGDRFGFDVLVYKYWDFPEAGIDEEYLENLHSLIGGRVRNRFYIVAPANKVQFIADYHEIEDLRYYFLRVPYSIIQELHKKEFKKFRQPQSKQKINSLDDAIGFQFVRQPEVESSIINNELVITQFKTTYSSEDTGKEMQNFESLSMILVDESYNEKEFCMTTFAFAEDLIKSKKQMQKDAEDEKNIFAEQIKAELINQKNISLKINPTTPKICVVYVDIYGNEFREEIKINSN